MIFFPANKNVLVNSVPVVVPNPTDSFALKNTFSFKVDSNLDIDRIKGSKKSIYLNEGSQFNNQEGYYWEGRWFFDYAIGARYGLNTETANSNPTFTIDKRNGVINFNSTMSG